MRHPLLAAETGLDIFVKHENHNPTGAFKVRGGLNLIGSLPPSERRGVMTATTGNHGQSIALACQREGVPCTIVVPVGNNPEKNAAMRALGAEVVEFGRDFDEARETVERAAARAGCATSTRANEPLLIAGVAHLRARDLRGAARRRRHPRADRRRQRRVRLRASCAPALGSRRAVIGVQAAARRCVHALVAQPARASSATGPTRSPKAWRRASPSI